MTAPGRILILVSLFAIAMGFLESAVVVYIREIYYPAGFDFPMVAPEGIIALTEILREAATILMLLCVGMIAGRSASERFAWFLYSFAVWDIFYYVFLRLLIGWPGSLLTWDILFLIPVTWVGPVLTPVLVSLTMIAFALIILHFAYRYGKARISPAHWIILVAGSLVLILSFTWDYSGYILNQYSFHEIWSIPGEQLAEIISGYIPRKFNWLLFCLGEGIILSGIILFFMQNRSSVSVPSDDPGQSSAS